jgi:hypothetical protein
VPRAGHQGGIQGFQILLVRQLWDFCIFLLFELSPVLIQEIVGIRQFNERPSVFFVLELGYFGDLGFYFCSRPKKITGYGIFRAEVEDRDGAL